MFCPYCGTESTQGLNYCNRCGGSLAPLARDGARETRPAVSAGAAWAAGLTTSAVVIVGLGMLLAATGDLTIRGMPPTAVVWIALFVALTVVCCTAMLLRFWSALLGVRAAAPAAAPQTPALPGSQATDTRELGDARFDALNPASIHSVTEQTTRTLEREVVNRKP